MLILERKINMNIEKLYPACKSIIWGGDRLKRYYGKKTAADPPAKREYTPNFIPRMNTSFI